jgi:hypothetical protein
MKFYFRLYRLAFWLNIYWINVCIVFDGWSLPKRMSYAEAQYLEGFKEITL